MGIIKMQKCLEQESYLMVLDLEPEDLDLSFCSVTDLLILGKVQLNTLYIYALICYILPETVKIT